MLRRPMLFLALLMLLVVSACGGDDDAGASTTTTVTAAPPETTTTAAPTTSTAAPTTTTTTAPPTTTAPTTTTALPPAARIEHLVAGPDGVHLVTADGARILLVDEWAEMAIDDGRGGLLFQEQRGLAFESSGIETLVWWVPTRAGAAQELLVPAPDQYLELVDAVEIEERLTVFYLRRTFGPDFETDTLQTLRRFDVAAVEVDQLAVVGGYESGSKASYGGERFAVSWAGEGICGLLFLDSGGAPIDPPAGAPAGALNGGECGTVEESFELSPDGSRMAYVVPGIDEPYSVVREEVVVADAATGAEIARFTAWSGEAEWFVMELDLDGDALIVNRISADDYVTRLPALLVDLSGDTPLITEAPLAGTARLVRAPVVIAEPITLP